MDKKIPKHEICYIYFLLLYNAISIRYDNDSSAVIINNYHNWIPLPSHTLFHPYTTLKNYNSYTFEFMHVRNPRVRKRTEWSRADYDWYPSYK